MAVASAAVAFAAVASGVAAVASGDVASAAWEEEALGPCLCHEEVELEASGQEAAEGGRWRAVEAQARWGHSVE